MIRPFRSGLLDRMVERIRERSPRRAAADAALPPGVGRLDYGRAVIRLTARTASERKRLRSCEKEPWTVRWIEDHVRPGETLYDVGANVGAYSLVAHAATRGQARVIAFEPGFSTYAALCGNIVLNGAGDAVRPLPLALGATTTLGTLQLRDLQAGAAIHVFGDTPADDVAFTQPVVVAALDDLVERFGLPAPDHLKLDVDGPELDVLEGARRVLAQQRVRTVLVEMDTGKEELIGAALAEHGYALRERSQRERPGDDKPPAYGLFAPA